MRRIKATFEIEQSDGSTTVISHEMLPEDDEELSFGLFVCHMWRLCSPEMPRPTAELASLVKWVLGYDLPFEDGDGLPEMMDASIKNEEYWKNHDAKRRGQ